MSTVFSSFADGFAAVWQPHYLPLIGLGLALALLLRQSSRRSLQLTVQVLGLFLFLLLLGSVAAANGADTYARLFAQLAVLVLGMLLIRLLAFSVFRLVVPRLGMQPPRILEELLVLAAYCAWVLLRLSAGGIDLGSLVASTAVLTAVLAFAMQDTLGNILSGLALQLDHSVHIGDWIELDDAIGQVTQVQWRHTTIRTLAGELIIIPNSQLMKQRIKLVGGPSVPYRMRIVEFYAGFDLRPTRVIERLNHSFEAAALRGVSLHETPYCRVAGYVHGQVLYRVIYWLSDPRSPGSTDGRVLHHVFTVFERNGWQMGAPANKVALETPAARQRQADSRLQHDVDRRYALLRRLDLFSPLSDAELHRLAASLQTAVYLKGTQLARQGEVGDCLFIVVSGEVDVWLESGGRRHALAVVGASNVLGEMSLLTGDPRSATLTARTDVECYLLETTSFQAILQERPLLADAFAALLAERNRGISDLQEQVSSDLPASHAGEQAALLARIRSFFGL